MELRSSDTRRFLHRAPAGTSGGTDIYSTATADGGAWYHVGIVKTAQTTTLYINGEVAGTAEDSAEFGQVLQNVTIGVLEHDNPARYFPGAIDEVYTCTVVPCRTVRSHGSQDARIRSDTP